MIVETFPVGLLQCNCTILGDEITRDAMVIDPGDDADLILAKLKAHRLSLKEIVCTHTHIDHVGAIFELQQKAGVPAAIHNYTSKAMRIRRLGQYLSQGRLKFLKCSPSTRLLVEQLRDFPCGAHDDGPDALEMAIRLAKETLFGMKTSDGLGSRLPVG